METMSTNEPVAAAREEDLFSAEDRTEWFFLNSPAAELQP
jgi:hypothetical protein